MPNLCPLVLTLLLPLTAFSSELPSQPQPQPQPQRPEPEVLYGAIRYTELKKFYDAGSATTADLLRGEWHLVAIATHINCTSFYNDETQQSGVKNIDATPSTSLLFADDKPESGKNSSTKMVVSVLNLGHDGADQGPYPVAPTQPEFKTWTYNSEGKERTDSYLSFSCRASATTHFDLVCGASYYMNPLLVGLDEKSCVETPNGFMLTYKKISK